MSIVRQFLQAALEHGYAQTMLAAIRDRAKMQEQIRMLESHKRQPPPYVPHSMVSRMNRYSLEENARMSRFVEEHFTPHRDTRGDSDGDDGA